MQIHLMPHHLALTPSLRDFAAAKIASLEDMVGDILAAHVTLRFEHSVVQPDRFSANVRLAVPGPDIHAHDSDPDLYAAIDNVVDKLARRLRKRKIRRQTRHNHRERAATPLAA